MTLALRASAFLAGLLAGCLVAAPGMPAPERIRGPVAARLLEIVDGDTLRVRARIWLGQDVETLIRIAGIDSPERQGRCAAERIDAERARRLLVKTLGDGPVILHDIEYGKYAGRVLARVESMAGEDAATVLLAAGLARAYPGGKRRPWCTDGAAAAQQ